MQRPDDFQASTVTVFQKVRRRVHPQLYIRREAAHLERGQATLHLRHPNMPADSRQQQEWRVQSDLEEYYEWQLELSEKALIK
jgi:hypothetical protein